MPQAQALERPRVGTFVSFLQYRGSEDAISTNEERINGCMERSMNGRPLPLNGAGVCGAVLADIDVPLGVVRGVALLARCAGLLGHLAEELDDPIANDIYMNVDRNTDYRPPPR